MRCAHREWVSDRGRDGTKKWVACGGLCPPSAPPPAAPPSPPSTPCQTVVVALWNPSESWEGIKLVLDGVEADISSDGPDGNYGTCLWEGCYEFTISGSPLPRPLYYKVTALMDDNEQLLRKGEGEVSPGTLVCWNYPPPSPPPEPPMSPPPVPRHVATSCLVTSPHPTPNPTPPPNQATKRLVATAADGSPCAPAESIAFAAPGASRRTTLPTFRTSG